MEVFSCLCSQCNFGRNPGLPLRGEWNFKHGYSCMLSVDLSRADCPQLQGHKQEFDGRTGCKVFPVHELTAVSMSSPYQHVNGEGGRGGGGG